MNHKKVYILHKNGANSHYMGLSYFLKKNNTILVYREFSILSSLFKGVTKQNTALFKKQGANIVFFISLLFSKNKKIVLGIAPYDSKLKMLLFFLKNHKVYYHTSWVCWDKSFQPKKIKNKTILKQWKQFLETKTKHIFTVTQAAKEQLLTNYKLKESNISVVYHSINPLFLEATSTHKIPNSFVYYGRLVPQKGIEELLNFFKCHKEATLTLIGEGSEKNTILKAVSTYKNIEYFPVATSKIELVKTLSTFQYVVVNSLKTNKWEELFGMIIIESMALSIIPIATNHPGPKEVIDPQIGYLCEEGKMSNLLKQLITTNTETLERSKRAREASKKYATATISNHWKAILC